MPLPFLAVGAFLVGKFWVVVIVAVVFFVLGFLVLYDQYAAIGVWFQISDIHHETFALVFAALGLGVLIGGLVVAADELHGFVASCPKEGV